MSIHITARAPKEKAAISPAIKSEINSLAHQLSQRDFMKHRNRLRTHALQLIASGADESEVISALREEDAN